MAERADGMQVALKQVRAENVNRGARFRLQREHGMLRSIESPFVGQPIDLLLEIPEPTLVLPWHGGTPLSDLAEPMAAPKLLDVACRR